jgi:dienelactone hydrolase
VEALYKSDREGVLDLDNTPAANRLYPTTEYMNLFNHLSLSQGEKEKVPPVFLSNVHEPMEHTVTVQGDNGLDLSTRLERVFAGPDIQYQTVRSSGLWGSFFAPETKEPVPGILVLGGAIGGSLWTERAAALLANHGYATLALTYFSTGNLPENLVEIPLEYFSAGLKWLREREEVDDSRLAIAGKSKGAEAALLVAQRARGLRCIVGYSASAVVYQGVQASGPILTARSSWTYRGQALPFVPCYREGLPINMEALKNLKEIHSANLDTAYIMRAAQIPVEEINAPILLVAGEADEVWPSVRFGEMIMSRLARNQKIQGSVFLTYANAGHGIDLPWLPCSNFGGGTTAANAKASEDAWKKSLEFLNKHLK